VISGVVIPENAKILCVIGAANLDPDHWPQGERFDIGRKPAGHLAFGAGIHGCVGQQVARAEAEALLTAIAIKVRTIELAGEPVWRPNNFVHGLDRLPVTFKGR
jgi:cytochrome P450